MHGLHNLLQQFLYMDPIIACMRQDLEDSADPQAKNSFQKFFREEVKCYGVRGPVVSRIARKYWKEVSVRDRQEIFRRCEELLASGYMEEAFVVSDWVPRMKARFIREDFTLFSRWIETYISNWAVCDSFCNHAVGDFIELFPEFVDELKPWTQSENRWVRRAAAVSLIVPAKHGKFIDEVIAIADLLLNDGDDMVRKGYGWLLKEASRKHQAIVFDYILKNRRNMPRTALRYAIELMPGAMRAEAMSMDW